MSFWRDANLLSGVAEYCVANRIRLLAYRPLGGPERRRRVQSDRLLTDIAAGHGATPFEIALAWLRDLSPLIEPLPGATRVDSARSIARVPAIALSDEDRARLDERVPAARRLRGQVGSVGQVGRLGEDQEEVVLIIGLPAAGKTTLAQTFVERGYERLNRDEAGGGLRDLVPSLERLLASGSRRIVLDNTYGSRAARAAVIEAVRAHHVPVRCLWLSTTIEDAQINALVRGTPAFAPTAQFRHQRAFEEPDPSEGFSRIEVMPFGIR